MTFALPEQPTEPLRRLGACGGELVVGDADGAPAGRLEDDVAFAVGFEGSSVAVVGVAVELGDEPVARPVQVDLVALDDAVGDRLREAVAPEERAEVALEV